MKGFEEIDHNWFPSPFGQDDQNGTLNHISGEKVIRSLQMPKLGKVFRLSHPMSERMAYRQTHGSYFFTTSLRSADYHSPFKSETENRFGANIGRLELSDHSGTHLDSLNHISIGGRLYNGHNASDVIGPRGSSMLGIDSTPPIVTRGLIIDLPSIRGVDVVENSGPSEKEISKFFREHEIVPEKGDAVFLYTGASRLWNDPGRFSGLYERSSGIGMECARWLVRNLISLSGSDSPSSEVSPPEIKGAVLPVHQYLITINGMRIIDNMKLDEVCSNRVYEFLFICAPLALSGGTGSPVSPLAIV